MGWLSTEASPWSATSPLTGVGFSLSMTPTSISPPGSITSTTWRFGDGQSSSLKCCKPPPGWLPPATRAARLAARCTARWRLSLIV